MDDIIHFGYKQKFLETTKTLALYLTKFTGGS
jgi:hypothetical protein